MASAATLKLRSGLNPATWRGHLETILPKPNKIKNEQHHKALPYADLPDFMKKLREMDSMSALALEFVIAPFSTLIGNATGCKFGKCRFGNHAQPV